MGTELGRCACFGTDSLNEIVWEIRDLTGIRGEAGTAVQSEADRLNQPFGGWRDNLVVAVMTADRREVLEQLASPAINNMPRVLRGQLQTWINGLAFWLKRSTRRSQSTAVQSRIRDTR
jgi:hypothetical protein